MKRSRLSITTISVFAILFGLHLALPANATGATYAFELLGPNTAKDPSSSETIRTTGSGSFDTSKATVAATGNFARFAADGSLIDRGTWEATAFVSFTDFGGSNPGRHGGALAITVTLFPNGGTPEVGLAMTVTCAIDAPPGTEEGVTVGTFTQKTGGLTLFQLHTR